MSGLEADGERDLSGTVLGRYRLVERLGLGGMGAVYRAQHEMLDRQVAIKVLNESLSTRAVARKRFLREARAASKVAHPGVVEIFDVALTDEHVYFVMELLRGRDLGDRLDVEGRLSWAQTQPIVVAVAEALAAAHEVGVIHRDVKPSNCFLVADAHGRDGPLKVVDFGIAKVAAGDRAVTEELTTTGEVFGTVGYMPPEMAQGVHDEPRSDIYELGVMMFRMLTGRLPFLGVPLHVLTQHIGRVPPAPRSLDSSIPVAVDRIIRRALEKLPDDRQPSMRHLVEELRLAAPGPEPEPEPGPRSRGRAPDRAGPVAAARAAAGRTVPSPSRAGVSRTRRPIAAAGPSASVSSADVIGLDERPDLIEAGVTDGGRRELPGRTSVYGEDPPRPPMPGESGLPLEMFQPPVSPRPELALDESAMPASPSTAPSDTSRSRWVPAAVLAGVVAALGAIVWLAFEPAGDRAEDRAGGRSPAAGLFGAHSSADAEVEPVQLLVDTMPRDARVYVDDELRSERPIEVPRSEEYRRVRVEAEGYAPRTIQVQPLRTRRLEVTLDREGRGRRPGER